MQGEVVGGGDGEPTVEKESAADATIGNESATEDWSGEDRTASSMGVEGLDSILAGDPLDLFQWDEWEALASELFAS